jgi:microcystin-dependent protein
MTVVSPTAKAQFIDAAGIPLAGGFLYTYAAGTTTPQATYTDSTGATANSNPIVLDSRGEANIWLGSATYKFRLTDANNTEIWTVDNLVAPSTSVSPVLAGNVTISTDNSGTALTITQTGSGAALKVQDSTDPDATPFIIDTNGSVGIGTPTPANALDIANGAIQLSSVSGTARTILSADSTDSIFAVSDARNFVVKTNSSTRLTINATNATSTVPVVLPADPTTSLQAATKAYVDLGSPAGIIAPFAGTTAPSGWLKCEGQAIDRTTYATLFAAIGTTWGSGNGSTTFNVPDLRGMFVRGTGTNATGSSSGAVGPSVGTYAADTYLNHSHTATDSGHTHTSTGGGSFLQTGFTAFGANISGGGGNYYSSVNSATGNAVITVATSTTGGTETKPKNYGVLYIIKT